jgi:hypothetical protein
MDHLFWTNSSMSLQTHNKHQSGLTLLKFWFFGLVVVDETYRYLCPQEADRIVVIETVKVFLGMWKREFAHLFILYLTRGTFHKLNPHNLKRSYTIALEKLKMGFLSYLIYIVAQCDTCTRNLISFFK